MLNGLSPLATASRHQVSSLVLPGPELVENGGFDSGDSWTVNDGSGTSTINIGAGKLNFVGGTTANNIWAEQDEPTLLAGASYECIFTISASVGAPLMHIRLGGGIGGQTANTAGADGTYTETVVCDAIDTKIRVRTSSMTAGNSCSIDNVSVKRVA